MAVPADFEYNVRDTKAVETAFKFSAVLPGR